MSTPPPNRWPSAPANQASFGALLREHRLAAGLSQEALAERAGVSVQAISLLENGHRRAPYRQTVAQLTRALDLSAVQTAALEAAVVRRRHALGSPAVWSSNSGGREASAVPAPDSGAPPLPRPLSSFVGREREMAALGDLLTSTRLLTLTGAGGCGKTRLAVEVAARLVARYADGVWLVDLAPLTDPALVLPTIAQVLGVREDPARPLAATLTDALRARRLLLVLDNCEHLIAACATAADTLLQGCARVQILATSREALRLPGETSWPLPSLTLPPAQAVPSLPILTQSEAVRLFVDRASAVRPRFALTPANAQAVARVCRELDGIPLALELAAARVRMLTVEELATRLDQRFRLLTAGSRTALPRQQTLRATVDWSYDLLAPVERTLFARLSVFAGGWALDAAEAVGAGAGIAAEDVLGLLARLVEQSLVVAEALDDGSTRYRLLETLRQYGRERLATGHEATLARDRRAAHYLALAERAEPELTGPAQLGWLDRLERDHDNLRAALAWSLERAEPTGGDGAVQAAECGLRLAGALFWFWFLHDHHPEALTWLERALARTTAASAAPRAKARFGAGVFAWSLNDLARSEALLAESVALSREIDDRRLSVLALGALGFTLCQHGQDDQGAAVVEEGVALARAAGEPGVLAYALLHRLLRVAYGPAIERDEERTRARAAGGEARRLYRAVGDRMAIAEVQLCLGELALYEGDHRRAESSFRAALPMMRAVGWRTSVADGLARLGDVQRAKGMFAAAKSLYMEALTLYRQSGRQLGANLAPHLPAVLCHLADIAWEQGDLATARADVEGCLTVLRDTRPAGGAHLPEALELRAALAAAQGAPRRAMRLAGASAAVRGQLHRPPGAAERTAQERRLAPARRALSAEDQAMAWAEGQALTAEQAIGEALAQ